MAGTCYTCGYPVCRCLNKADRGDPDERRWFITQDYEVVQGKHLRTLERAALGTGFETRAEAEATVPKRMQSNIDKMRKAADDLEARLKKIRKG